MPLPLHRALLPPDAPAAAAAAATSVLPLRQRASATAAAATAPHHLRARTRRQLGRPPAREGLPRDGAPRTQPRLPHVGVQPGTYVQLREPPKSLFLLQQAWKPPVETSGPSPFFVIQCGYGGCCTGNGKMGCVNSPRTEGSQEAGFTQPSLTLRKKSCVYCRATPSPAWKRWRSGWSTRCSRTPCPRCRRGSPSWDTRSAASSFARPSSTPGTHWIPHLPRSQLTSNLLLSLCFLIFIQLNCSFMHSTYVTALWNLAWQYEGWCTTLTSGFRSTSRRGSTPSWRSRGRTWALSTTTLASSTWVR